uniref:Uncharacterized protein n=1 Tax=Aegilops tauschii subsp. strangulata TaxID=200361 RepID=A0A452YFW7_AEGTS
GSVQVSKDIKYADNQPIVPWGPRYSRATAKDVQINMAISATFTTCILTMGHADWKPLQFLCFAYFYRILEKLKSTEPAITPVYNRSMVRLKAEVYIWQSECFVVWVW